MRGREGLVEQDMASQCEAAVIWVRKEDNWGGGGRVDSGLDGAEESRAEQRVEWRKVAQSKVQESRVQHSSA